MLDQKVLSKLSALAGSSQNEASKQAIKRVVINFGISPVEHYPKLKGADGKTQKDTEGNDLRSDKSDGFMYTFSDFKTSKMVKVVLSKKYNLPILGAFIVEGLGYYIASGNMYFIDENTGISRYE